MRRRHLLIVGGTGEARILARIAADAFRVTTSLAGATDDPALPSGEVRKGGFGGTEGLIRYLDESFIDLVVDATHPYAARISKQVREACIAAGIPRLQLYRPGWERLDSDHWIDVETWAQAADLLPQTGRRPFLTIGRKNLADFASVTGCQFLVRLLTEPVAPLSLPEYDLIIGPPALRASAEIALMKTHHVDLLISKNSGGDAAMAKIIAARELDLPILTLRRPDPQPGPKSSSVEETLKWLGLVSTHT
ncbi:cobalt-precorrin-6A reductase [Magnetospira sp. QH-2]|uniref:cobalt-precorrin-6A reductase n=1 Tax=Magnetospira sp. (strain QH-2) TaxID=1288970 RepID=UPI0003E80A90|nr:cobalt-precorrin-6A reductase [Magnetospira sp. QH-2]CCQ75567.1 Precorrin-6A reductase [Magnetospira sp. QH-2]